MGTRFSHYHTTLSHIPVDHAVQTPNLPRYSPPDTFGFLWMLALWMGTPD